MIKIGLVIEGHGEVGAVPLLVRNLLHSSGMFDAQVAQPVRVGGLHNMLNSDSFVRQMEFAWSDPSITGLMVVADCDDDCPVDMREALAKRILSTVGNRETPIAIVLLNREFEALFLSQADHLTEVTSFFDSGEDTDRLVANCTSIRNAKLAVAGCIKDFAYKATRDQARLAAHLNLELLGVRHRAGKRLMSALTQIVEGRSDLSVFVE